MNKVREYMVLDGKQISQRQLISTYLSINEFSELESSHYTDFRAWCTAKGIVKVPSHPYYRSIKSQVKRSIGRGPKRFEAMEDRIWVDP